jgi:hypothetical protein
MAQKKNSRSDVHNALTRSWWVVLFILLSGVVYAQAVQKKQDVFLSLERHLEALQSEKKALLVEQEDLNLQVNSQGDPAWIELTLMKGLGLVPEGQMKVYFHHEDE